MTKLSSGRLWITVAEMYGWVDALILVFQMQWLFDKQSVPEKEAVHDMIIRGEHIWQTGDVRSEWDFHPAKLLALLFHQRSSAPQDKALAPSTNHCGLYALKQSWDQRHVRASSLFLLAAFSAMRVVRSLLLDNDMVEDISMIPSEFHHCGPGFENGKASAFSASLPNLYTFLLST